MPTPIEILSALVRVLDGQERDRREEAARNLLRELREQFAREYRAMAAELRARGTAPRQTLEEYEERRFREVLP